MCMRFTKLNIHRQASHGSLQRPRLWNNNDRPTVPVTTWKTCVEHMSLCDLFCIHNMRMQNGIRTCWLYVCSGSTTCCKPGLANLIRVGCLGTFQSYRDRYLCTIFRIAPAERGRETLLDCQSLYSRLEPGCPSSHLLCGYCTLRLILLVFAITTLHPNGKSSGSLAGS